MNWHQRQESNVKPYNLAHVLIMRGHRGVLAILAHHISTLSDIILGVLINEIDLIKNRLKSLEC